MSHTPSPLFFPNDRATLAMLLPPGEGETDTQWLARAVHAKAVVLVTTTDARDPQLYKLKLADAAERKARIVFLQGEDVKGAAPPELSNQAAYLKARRAGKSPDEAAAIANDGDDA